LEGVSKTECPLWHVFSFLKHPPFFAFYIIPARYHITKKKKSEQVLMLSKVVSLRLYPTPNI
jgi:hypothetical protein